jgi:hypothetical protein
MARLGLLWPEPPQETYEVVVFCDAGWASAPGSKSTSGGVMTLNGSLIGSWSRTQNTISLSSAEGELGAMAHGGSEGLCVAHLLQDLGLASTVRILTDSTAALGITHRVGPGRVKHLTLKLLWLQAEHSKKTLLFGHVPGVENVADLMTKALPAPRFRQLRHHVGEALDESTIAAAGARCDHLSRTISWLGETSAASSTSAEWPWTLSALVLGTCIFAGLGCAQVVAWCSECVRSGACCRRRPVETSMRTVSVQGPTTHTSVRGAATPRFAVLPEGEFNAWPQ